jgi:sec-independent protein translocase protein TatA
MELIIVLAIVLIIFGVGKLPSIGGAMGKAVRGFRTEAEGEKPKASANTEEE